jgi:hypothetical protein
VSSFRTLHGHVNPMTGAITWFDEPVEIHEDDIDWLMRMWDEGDLLDWEIWRASRLPAAGLSAFRAVK